MNGPCAKQRVTATIVTRHGEHFVGENDCANPQTVCPRSGMATGEGYHLCHEICRQTGHAETNALKLAGEKAAGATLYVEGHSYACDACRVSCSVVGIAEIIIGAPPRPSQFTREGE